MNVPKRKSAKLSKDRPVKTTLSLDVTTYTRLCAKAAMRRIGISALAAEFIQAGLRGMVVIDRSESSQSVDNSNRPALVIGLNDDGENAA